MATLQWNDTLSVGVAAIDAEHKQLFAMVNDLHSAMQAGKSKEILGDLLNRLLTYTKTHFKTEERLLQQRGYPRMAEHVKEHEAFVRKAVEAKTKFEAGSGTTISIDLMQFLSQWLLKHVKGEDQAYAKFFAEPALQAGR